MGKDEERAKIQVKGGTRASSGMERIGKGKFESVEERVKGCEGGGDG